MKRQYVDILGSGHRLRVSVNIEKGQVTHWAVQLEWLELGENWVWIARYDTSGGHPHRDRNRIAKHEPVQLVRNPGRAIQEAKQELETHYRRYTEDYQAAKVAGRKAW